MKVIGLTGGIGSGKSTVARVFESLGFPVFDSDREALSIYESDPTLLTEVVEIFGGDMLLSDGRLNRKALAERVFSDEAALKKLNALVHPRVARKFDEWKNQQHSTVVIREAAILFESGSDAGCDRIIVVTAPETLRIHRVMQRSGLTELEVRARMARQWPEEKLLERADEVVVNDDLTLVLPQVMALALVES
ncbi:MAG: dephospho-CoA kinase [Flavobacteriales bacterium]